MYYLISVFSKKKKLSRIFKTLITKLVVSFEGLIKVGLLYKQTKQVNFTKQTYPLDKEHRKQLDNIYYKIQDKIFDFRGLGNGKSYLNQLFLLYNYYLILYLIGNRGMDNIEIT